MVGAAEANADNEGVVPLDRVADALEKLVVDAVATALDEGAREGGADADPEPKTEGESESVGKPEGDSDRDTELVAVSGALGLTSAEVEEDARELVDAERAGVSDAHSVVVTLGLDDGESEPQADTEGVAAALLETDAEASGLREDDTLAEALLERTDDADILPDALSDPEVDA